MSSETNLFYEEELAEGKAAAKALAQHNERKSAMTKKITIGQLQNFAASCVTTGTHQLEDFNKKYADNPAYAFEWSGGAFEAAAKVWVGKTLQAWLANEEVAPEGKADAIMEEVNRLVVRAARWPERSTSVQSNEMSRCKAAVWAELVAKQQGW